MGLLLAYMMLIHFIADFLLQSREMGKNKSVYFPVLLQHVSIQLAAFAFLLTPFLGPKLAIIFAVSNAIIHGVIDWYIWRLYKLSVANRLLKILEEDDTCKEWPGFESQAHHDMAMLGNASDEEKVRLAAASWRFWEDHWFYTTIGLDQLLHALTIIFLFSVLV